MQKLLFILIGFVFLKNAVAQKNNQPCAYAFSILIQPGTVPVDENGVQTKAKINKERFVYVMIPGKIKPTIKSVQFNKTAVKWELIDLAEKEFSAVSESTQKKMKIKPFKGGTMWRINIQEYTHHSIPLKAVPVIIKGNIGNKPFAVITNMETAVQGYDSY